MRLPINLPTPLLTLLYLALPASYAFASPKPALVAEEYVHLMPRNTLFFRQVNNLNTFTGNVGGVGPLPITNSGDAERPFAVDGDTFPNFEDAVNRSCDRQQNQCSQAANDGDNQQFQVGDCDQQRDDCLATLQNAQVQDFNSGIATQNFGEDPDFPDFDLICEV